MSAGKKQKWVPGTQVPIASIHKPSQKGKSSQKSKQGGADSGFFMTSVNTKKGAVDFKGEEGMDEINEDDEELDDSSFALKDRSIDTQ